MTTSSAVVSTDMFEMLSPVLYVSRIFCLQPLKWTKMNYGYVITKSAAYTAYSNVVIVFFGMSPRYTFYVNFFMSDRAIFAYLWTSF
jgi:hypothetical protein